MSEPHIMILAGEASGDAHAAEFVEILRRRQAGLRFSGMGSKAMRRAGIDVFFDSSIIAMVGLVEVLRHWGDIKRAMAIVRDRMEQTRPDLLVLVDYPEFNLKMARHAKSLGIPVLFYVSPQVWAWRPRRIHKIGRLIDHMAVIFRFEKKYYEDAGIPVTFVGHPLVGKVRAQRDAKSMREQLEIAENARVVGLFPGSRHSEISRLLPLMLATAQRMQAEDAELRFVLPVAPTLDYAAVVQQVEASGVNIVVTEDDIYDVITCCDAVATCSGTVTLEIALLEVPMCIVYKMAPISYQIMKRLVTIPHIGLVNIVAQQAVVRELIQADANPELLSQEMTRLLADDAYRATIGEGLLKVRHNLETGKRRREYGRIGAVITQ